MLGCYSRGGSDGVAPQNLVGVRVVPLRRQVTERVHKGPVFAQASRRLKPAAAQLPVGNAIDFRIVCGQFASRGPGCPTHPGPPCDQYSTDKQRKESRNWQTSLITPSWMVSTRFFIRWSRILSCSGAKSGSSPRLLGTGRPNGRHRSIGRFRRRAIGGVSRRSADFGRGAGPAPFIAGAGPAPCTACESAAPQGRPGLNAPGRPAAGRYS